MSKNEIEESIRVDSKKLTNFSVDILTEVGLEEKEAKIVADSLIDANLKGIDTHGITRLSIYVQRLRCGIVNNSPQMKIENHNTTTAVLDGDNGQGQVVAMKATEEAIKMSNENGTGFVAVKHSNHFGTAAYYAQKIMEEGHIGLVFSNAPSTMVPFGGADPFFGTNPVAIAIPTEEKLPIVLDMATSVVARGNIILADKEGEDIPKGWAVDKDGNPTTDTKEALEGAVLPLGGPKGSGLALVVDILSGVLSGAAWGQHLNSIYTNFEEPQNVGHFIGAINIEGFMPFANFGKRVDKIIKEVKAVQPAPGFDEVCLPGELENRKKNERLEKGIPLGEGVQNELIKLGKKCNIDFNNYIEENIEK